MNIFTTVGNTRFDALFEEIDKIENHQKWQLIHQISDGQYLPKKGSYFRFVDNIDQYYADADIVITHGGAGTIFKLLELGKKIIVVLNSQRLDPHQTEIVNYIHDNEYGLACFDLRKLPGLLNKITDFSPIKYKKPAFFKTADIIEILDIM